MPAKKTAVKNNKTNNKPKNNKTNNKNNKSCPKGEILRDAYTTKNGTKVKANCITNRGLPGKGEPSIILNNNHYLSSVGYNDVKDLSVEKRRSALNKAVKEKGFVPVIRMLTARFNLLSRISPEAHNVMKSDQMWLSKKYAHLKKVKASNTKPVNNNKKPSNNNKK